ncbi:hypothetical protein J0X15_19985 [Roseibium sp. CAU 1637]|uniref:Uncharacterized protein n=1 Tax=Roseibium limicola TaxID=2816037 RepID=A0A939ER89_9HYPH|nr:hypothetical protein [Roseibium limicola]MBO0347515.1 hypothetical protein [Roseibium limicola]
MKMRKVSCLAIQRSFPAKTGVNKIGDLLTLVYQLLSLQLGNLWAAFTSATLADQVVRYLFDLESPVGKKFRMENIGNISPAAGDELNSGDT